MCVFEVIFEGDGFVVREFFYMCKMKVMYGVMVCIGNCFYGFSGDFGLVFLIVFDVDIG